MLFKTLIVISYLTMKPITLLIQIFQSTNYIIWILFNIVFLFARWRHTIGFYSL